MSLRTRVIACLTFCLGMPGLASTAIAGENWLTGTRTITLHSRDGQALPIGRVRFQPTAAGTSYVIDLDHKQLNDYFLSMREFKCAASEAEVFCYVPYPHATPRTVTANNLAWLEHDLMFFYKQPRDFGAKLWNGIYFELKPTADGLIGTAQAIDLNQIAAPPADLTVPPYGKGERSDFDPALRWFNRLSIR